ncbi:MAG: glycosyltransferase [Desulfobulbaceae bacterium]|nr:glycosyltransferase [Desulfobulbaceae bacterium]
MIGVYGWFSVGVRMPCGDGLEISIITVSKNSVTTIADTIKSVLSQKYNNIEYIVVDGGSVDGTADVVGCYGDVVDKFVTEEDNGIYDAMNKGIQFASGEVIGFINSDDFYASSEVIVKVAKVFSDPTVDACYGDLCYVKQGDVNSVIRYWRSSEFTPGLFLHGWCPPHPTFFVRRCVFERLGGFDLQYKIAADVELMIRFIEVNRIRTRYIPEVLVNMRMGGASNSSWSNVLMQNREIWHVLSEHNIRPSLISFVVGKLLLRGKQFFSRPG